MKKSFIVSEYQFTIITILEILNQILSFFFFFESNFEASFDRIEIVAQGFLWFLGIILLRNGEEILSLFQK